jgi:hypothetical protein
MRGSVHSLHRYAIMAWCLIKYRGSFTFTYSKVRLTAGAGNFSLHHRVQNGSGAHQASYPMGKRGSFPGGKAAGALSCPLTSI